MSDADSNSRVVNVIPQDRVVERTRGCWNCTGWNNSSLAESHFEMRQVQDARTITEQTLKSGVPFEAAMKHVVQIMKRAEVFKPPATGICMKNGSKADFVLPTFLCDKWTGRIVVQGASEGDVIAEELYDKKGEKL